MSQARGSQLWLQYHPADHGACKLETFLEKQPILQHVQVVYPCDQGPSEPPSKRPKHNSQGTSQPAATPPTNADTSVAAVHSRGMPQDWFQGKTPLQYSTKATLSALVTEDFLTLSFGAPSKCMAAVALKPQPLPGVSAVVHPSGWLSLRLDAATYQRLGLTGHRVAGPKHQRNLSAARSARGGGEYAVLVKLKGLASRPKQHGRVQTAFARLQERLAWRMVFLRGGEPAV
eukprot:jgi/Ulvmu1/6586/UM003_0223.1